MRILIVSPKILDDSLSATSRLATIAHLGLSHHVVVLARFRKPHAASIPGVSRVVPVAAPRIPLLNLLWFILSASLRLPSLLKAGCYDVVMVEPASVLPTAIGMTLAPKRAAPPVHLDCRTMPVPGNGWRERLDIPFTSLTLAVARRTCSGFSAITSGVAEWLGRQMRIETSEVSVWSTGVDPALFAERGSDSVSEPVPVRFMYHGALNLSRGLDTLLHAFRLLADDHSAALTIVGSGTDKDALVSLRDRLGLQEIVDIRPPVPLIEMPSVIHGHHCGVIPLPDLPCWSTSSPTKLMEYLATATPVVLTAIAAHLDIASGSGAVVWCQSTAEDLARALGEVVKSLPSMSEAAHRERPAFVARFAWDVQSARLEKALYSTARSRVD